MKELIKIFIIGVGLFLLLVVVTIFLGTTLGNFIDLPSLLFVILTNVALILATRSIQDFLYGIKVLVNRKMEIEQVKLQESVKIFDLLQRS